MSARLLTFVLVVAVVLAGAPSAAGAGVRLPDLEQEVPGDISVMAGESAPGVVEYRLGFRSAVRNVGNGPLVIDGSRPDVTGPAMTAEQVISCRDCARRVVHDVGELRFVEESDHRHWHLLGFQRYELRRPGGSRGVVRDHKSGFCLGDRYGVSGIGLPNRAPRARFKSGCGLEQPQLLRIREGISVGYGDDYRAFIEGQYLPLTGVPAGRYVLVHRVNRSRHLRETRYSNNASSVLLRLRWTNGVPSVKVLRSCAGSARCSR